MKDEDDSPVDACFEGAPAVLGYAGPFVRWNHRQEAADIHVQVGKSVFYRWANLRFPIATWQEQKRDGFNFISNDLFCTSTSNIRNIRKG